MKGSRSLLFSPILWLLLPPCLCLGQNTQYQLMTLDTAGYKYLQSKRISIQTQFDLLLLRGVPSYLDDKAFMRYFIMLNNCQNPNAGMLMKALDSEFDYPKMEAFYKGKAAEILNVVPTSLTVTMRSYTDPQNPQRALSYELGDYDMASKAFPFVDGQNKPVTITLDNIMIPDDRVNLNYSCGGALQQVGHGDLARGPVHIVYFPKISFSRFVVDENAARQYVMGPGVGAAGVGRSVTLLLDVEVLPDTPKVASMQRSNTIFVQYKGNVKKITVLDNRDRPIGTLQP